MTDKKMTDKEAAEIIKVARAEVEWEYPMEYAAAFDRAIEVLEQEPTIKNDVIALDFSDDIDTPNKYQTVDGKWHEGRIPTTKNDSGVREFKEIVKDGLRTVFDTESYASEDGGNLIRYEDAVGMVEELDFIQPKKTVGKLISIEVLVLIKYFGII